MKDIVILRLTKEQFNMIHDLVGSETEYREDEGELPEILEEWKILFNTLDTVNI